MKSYTAKIAPKVLAEQVLFTNEEKEMVLAKQRVMKYGGEVKVTRPGPDGEDSFFVGLSVDYSYMLVPEGDYLVTDPATGKQSVMAKDAFERSFNDDEAEAKEEFFDHELTQEDIDANPELLEQDLKVGDVIQVPKKEDEDQGSAEPEKKQGRGRNR